MMYTNYIVGGPMDATWSSNPSSKNMDVNSKPWSISTIFDLFLFHHQVSFSIGGIFLQNFDFMVYQTSGSSQPCHYSWKWSWCSSEWIRPSKMILWCSRDAKVLTKCYLVSFSPLKPLSKLTIPILNSEIYNLSLILMQKMKSNWIWFRETRHPGSYL